MISGCGGQPSCRNCVRHRNGPHAGLTQEPLQTKRRSGRIPSRRASLQLLLGGGAKRFETLFVIARCQLEIVGPEPQHRGLEL